MLPTLNLLLKTIHDSLFLKTMQSLSKTLIEGHKSNPLTRSSHLETLERMLMLPPLLRLYSPLFWFKYWASFCRKSFDWTSFVGFYQPEQVLAPARSTPSTPGDRSPASANISSVFYKNTTARPCIVVHVEPRPLEQVPEEPPTITVVLITGFSGQPLDEAMAKEEFNRVVHICLSFP
jgi:hypothetical protein